MAKEKEKINTFDTDADFIPFEFSDEERSPVEEEETQINGDVNLNARKRKRDDSSPERAPLKQRQKTSEVAVNPWQKSIDDYSFTDETARIEVQDFARWVAPTKEEIEVRAFVVNRIIETIELEFPECRAFPFGSYITKLYIPDADIDMVVNWPEHEWNKVSMRQLGRRLERRGIGKSFQYVFGAKVPIIKFVDTYARIDIDLAFNQADALNVAKIVQSYLTQMPAVQPLVMTLKTLFNQNNLSIPAEGGLGSYSIICLVISFLQRHPKIAAGHILAEENLGAMLLEILELYGTKFNYDRVGITIDGGGSYFDKLPYQRAHPLVWKKICIRDPNNASNNIAKASHQADAIVNCFGDAFRRLSNRCYLVNARLKEKAPWGTRRGSLLDAIVKAPALEIRERIRNKWTREMNGLGEEREVSVRESGASMETLGKKPNRAERRAAERAAKEAAKKAANQVEIVIPPKTNNPLSPELSPSPRKPRAKSPGKRKAPTAIVTGTRDAPILLDDSPSASVTTPTSPKKKTGRQFNSNAIANLAATGSISGVAKTITID